MPSQSLGKFLDSDAGLARFAAHAARLLKFQHLYECMVSPALARYGRVANLKQGKIVIYAGNSAIAAKIRQLAPRLADVFNQAGAQVSEVQVKVQPWAGARLPTGKGERAELGVSSRESLDRLAGGLPEQSPLKAALQRLAERAKLRGR